jgi:hypothetical protein
MKKLGKLVLSVTLIILFNSSVFAQQAENRKTTFSIEIDPATFAFKGYGFHFRVNPKNHKNLLVGAGAYAMNFPDVLVNLNSKNKDQGWNVRLNQGYGLFAEHHFLEVNKKWFVGGQLAIQQYKIQKDFFDGQSSFSTVLLMGTGGYTLQPFSFPVYFKFWGGVGYTAKISGENSIANAEYDISPLLLFGALHIGYTF